MSIFNDKQEKDIIDKYQSNIDIDLIIKEYNSEEHFIREVLKDKQIDRKYSKGKYHAIMLLKYLFDDIPKYHNAKKVDKFCSKIYRKTNIKVYLPLANHLIFF